MSHWQKTKLKHKEGQKKKEIEKRFGIKTMRPVVQRESMLTEIKKEIKKDPEMFEKLKDSKKSKTKKKSK